jgi:hypothetical protein
VKSCLALLSFVTALALNACAPSVEPIRPPDHTTTFCLKAQVSHDSSVESILTSTDDRVLAAHPNAAAVQKLVRASGGVIAFWKDDQLLLVPNTAKALGESGRFAHVLEIAIPIAPENATNRIIALRVRDHGEPRWIEMRAFDVQNPCVEGKRQA